MYCLNYPHGQYMWNQTLLFFVEDRLWLKSQRNCINLPLSISSTVHLDCNICKWSSDYCRLNVIMNNDRSKQTACCLRSLQACIVNVKISWRAGIYGRHFLTSRLVWERIFPYWCYDAPVWVARYPLTLLGNFYLIYLPLPCTD